MDALRRFVCVVFGLVVSVGLGVLVMTKGWGLEPQNWWWIVGVGVFGQVLAAAIVQMGTTQS